MDGKLHTKKPVKNKDLWENLDKEIIKAYN